MYKLTINFTPIGQAYFNDAPKMELYSNFEDDLQNVLKTIQTIDTAEEMILDYDIDKDGYLELKDSFFEKPKKEPPLPMRITARNKSRAR